MTGQSDISGFIMRIYFIQHLKMHVQSRQIYKLLLKLRSLDVRLPLPLPHPFRLPNLLYLIHLLHVLVLLIRRFRLIIIYIDNRYLNPLIPFLQLWLSLFSLLHSRLI